MNQKSVSNWLFSQVFVYCDVMAMAIQLWHTVHCTCISSKNRFRVSTKHYFLFRHRTDRMLGIPAFRHLKNTNDKRNTHYTLLVWTGDGEMGHPARPHLDATNTDAPYTSTLQVAERDKPCTSEVNARMPGKPLVRHGHFFRKLTVSVRHRHSGNRVKSCTAGHGLVWHCPADII